MAWFFELFIILTFLAAVITLILSLIPTLVEMIEDAQEAINRLRGKEK